MSDRNVLFVLRLKISLFCIKSFLLVILEIRKMVITLGELGKSLVDLFNLI